MSSYHGGKSRIGEDIANVIYEESMDIEEDFDFDIKGYCEPFCGMLGVYRHIPELFEDFNIKYKAGDMNKSVIAMWKAAQKGWVPPTTKASKTTFERLKKSPTSSAEKGFVGHLSSFRSIYFGGYDARISTKRYATTSAKVQQIASDLKKVSFKAGSYTQFSKLKGYVIYCDPPYDGGEQRYKQETGHGFSFDSGAFWKWCEHMAKDNIVFVSEYKAPKRANAPKGVEKIWSNGKEKLYMMY